jgi:hypothetical protein
MNKETLSDLLEREYPRFLYRLKEDNLETVRGIFRELANTPSPSASLWELYFSQKKVIENIFDWGRHDYDLSINRRNDIILLVGSLQQTSILIDLVPHGDQVSFYPVLKENGHRYEGPGLALIDAHKNHVQIFPTHKSRLGIDVDDKTAVGRPFHAACYVFDDVAREGKPGLRLITKGMVKCVEKMPEIKLDLDDTSKSPYIFEYEGNFAIPDEALIIYDNTIYFSEKDSNMVECASGDDKAGICAALMAVDMLRYDLKQRNCIARIITSSFEEGPSDSGPYGWAEGALYPTIRSLAKGATPPTDAIIIDGHTSRNGTQPGIGSVYGLRSGGGAGARSSQNMAELLKMNSEFLDTIGAQFSLNRERFSRSSEVWVKFIQNPYMLGFPIKDSHLPPETINLKDIVDLGKATALLAAENFMWRIKESYLQPYG